MKPVDHLNPVATSVKSFIEFVKTVPSPRTIYMEEGFLAAWAQETDLLAKYVERLLDPKRKAGEVLDRDFLEKHGFLKE